MRARRVGLAGIVAACALSVALLPPATATAAKKKTIGSDLKGTPTPGTGYSCGLTGPCAIAQIKLPGDPHGTRAPFKGVLRKWRFRTTDEDPEGSYGLRLAVVRKVGAGASGDGEPVDTRFRFVRRTAEKIVGPEPGTYRFKARLKVKKGDFIALELPYGPDNPSVQEFYVPHADALDYSWFPAPPPGSADNPYEANAETEYLYNATIKKKKKRR